MNDPIDNVKWVDAFSLRPNPWNPNVVFNKELELLEFSIFEYGWSHAVIANTNGLIIDGYHRNFLAKNSEKLLAKYEGVHPAILFDIDDKEAMMMTVRMNRARGTHAALRMRDLVQDLIDNYGATPDELIEKMGMTEGEVALLYDGTLLKRKNLQNRKYSKAWKPIETRLTKLVEPEFEREEDD